MLLPIYTQSGTSVMVGLTPTLTVHVRTHTIATGREATVTQTFATYELTLSS